MRWMFRLHKTALRAGLIVLPRHHYISFPDIIELERTKDSWARRSELIGIEADVRGQADRLRQFCAPFAEEYRGNPYFLKATAGDCGPGFGYIEAQVLHGVIRSLKPRRVIEVGCGVSTYCMLQALALNEQAYEMFCVEPYPRAWLKKANATLIDRAVQTVPLEFFGMLGKGDFLFIDSSHTVKTGSDVNFIILEVLPRLKPGVLVHFHDIYLPYDYSPDSLGNFMQWQETALLHAFLIGNRNMRILFSLSQLHYERNNVLTEVFPEYRPKPNLGNGLREATNHPGHFPSSTYLESID